jgi:hypothetical protein
MSFPDCEEASKEGPNQERFLLRFTGRETRPTVGPPISHRHIRRDVSSAIESSVLSNVPSFEV